MKISDSPVWLAVSYAGREVHQFPKLVSKDYVRKNGAIVFDENGKAEEVQNDRDIGHLNQWFALCSFRPQRGRPWRWIGPPSAKVQVSCEKCRASLGLPPLP